MKPPRPLPALPPGLPHRLTLVRLTGERVRSSHTTPMGVRSRVARYRRARRPQGVAVLRVSLTDTGAGSESVFEERQGTTPEAGLPAYDMGEPDSIDRWTHPAPDDDPEGPRLIRAAQQHFAGAPESVRADAVAVAAHEATHALDGARSLRYRRTDEARAAYAAGEAPVVLVHMPVGGPTLLHRPWWLHERFPPLGQESRAEPVAPSAALLLLATHRLHLTRRSDAGTLVWSLSSTAPLSPDEVKQVGTEESA